MLIVKASQQRLLRNLGKTDEKSSSQNVTKNPPPGEGVQWLEAYRLHDGYLSCPTSALITSIRQYSAKTTLHLSFYNLLVALSIIFLYNSYKYALGHLLRCHMFRKLRHFRPHVAPFCCKVSSGPVRFGNQCKLFS